MAHDKPDPSKYDTHLGIPRRLIPWYPTIDADRCTGCGKCGEFCLDDVYGYLPDGTYGVVNPYHCEVYCSSCAHACGVEAIAFPDRKEIKATIKELRKTYPPG
jgi:NAD-dependent dihydropyrimidine dehydrogenase PreA subunit